MFSLDNDLPDIHCEDIQSEVYHYTKIAWCKVLN